MPTHDETDEFLHQLRSLNHQQRSQFAKAVRKMVEDGGRFAGKTPI